MMNVAIIGDVVNTPVFKQACIDVPRALGANGPDPQAEWPFMNLSWGAYMMYCLIVVPKELYGFDNSDAFYADLKQTDAMRYFRVKKEKHSFTDDPGYHLRNMRNAVSHVNGALFR